MEPALWRYFVCVARGGRVRRRIRGLRSYSWRDKHVAAAGGDSLQRLSLFSRVCRGVAAHADVHGQPGGKENYRVENASASYGAGELTMSIEVRDVRKTYGKFDAVRSVSLRVEDG